MVTANNDPGGLTDDGRLDNDPWYFGGPWSPHRAFRIDERLRDYVDAGAPLSFEDMQSIQADKRSPLGARFSAFAVAAVEWARGAAEEGEDEALQQARDLYVAHQERLDDAAARLEAWAARGWLADSGVETFYHQPSEDDRRDAVATSIFNAWFPRMNRAVWRDEELDSALPFDGSRVKIYALERILAGRGAENPSALASWSPERGESVFFDDISTPLIERSELVILQTLVDALDALAEPADEDGKGGYGSDAPSDWLWGLRHQSRFESLLTQFLGGGSFDAILDQFSITTRTLPLLEGLEDDDPRAALKWFPRPGDNWGVDAANPGFGKGKTAGNGPIMRMVIQLNGDQVRVANVLPGGQSGLNNSENFADQLRLWLANEAIELPYQPEEVVEARTQTLRLGPPSP